MTRATGGPLRVASLAKQVPVAESFRLEEGRLVRRGVEVEMNAYCRRAVAEGVTLARATQGTCTAVTLGPPGAEDVLREAIAWGANSGLHVCDPAFAGSDTLATARALAAVLQAAGPFDLVLLGRNSIDGETGQVGPEVATLLDLPFASGVRGLEDDGACLRLVLEHDDGMQEVEITLPAVLSVAERLCEPCKVDRQGRAAVPASLITRVTARELGDGPWGQAGSPTVVGETRPMEHDRSMLVLEGAVEEQVRAAVHELTRRGALDAGPAPGAVPVTVTVTVPDAPVDPPAHPGRARRPEPASRPIAVLVEPGRPEVTGELLAAAARLGRATGAAVHALSTGDGTTEALGAAGADLVVVLDGSRVPEDVADAVADYVRDLSPWALLAPSTAFGREVAGRAAALTGSGLVGDAIALSARGGVLVAAKPAFAGALVADITCTSATQMATVRPGVLPVAVHEHRPARLETRRHRDAGPRPRAVRAPRRRRRDACPRPGGDRRGDGGGAGGIRAVEPARRAPGGRARRDQEGHRPGVGAALAPGRHHGPVHRPAPVRRARAEWEVQSRGGRARRGHHPGHQQGSRRTGLRALRHRHRGRLARGRAAPAGRAAEPRGRARRDRRRLRVALLAATRRGPNGPR